MLCEKCGIREANIKYTEVFNGVKTEHNLCAQCAKEMDLGPYSALIEGEFPLGKLLSSLLGLTDASASQAPKEDVVCPTCGTTYEGKFEPYRQTSEDPAAQSGGCRGDEEGRTGIQPGRAD